MTQPIAVDIKESNNKRRSFHQTHAIFKGSEHDYPLPEDVRIVTSPEGMRLSIGELSTDTPSGHISEGVSAFGVRTKEVRPPYFGDVGSYRNTTVIHVPGHADHIPETNRRDTFISYREDEGQEAISDSIRQFFGLNHRDPYEPPNFIESLRPLPTFLTQGQWTPRLGDGAGPEQLIEIVRHIQGDGNSDSFGGISDSIASLMPLNDSPPLQERGKVEVAIVIDRSGHPQALRGIVPVPDPMKPTFPTTEDLNRFSSYISGVWPDYPKLTQKTESSATAKEQARLLDDLRTAFRQEPFEDGVEHEAEQIIASALKEAYTLPWLREFITNEEEPVFAASVLGCLGRQISPGSETWRCELVRTALTINNIEVRDAAVVAAHEWGDKELARVLTSHQESVPWLHHYIQVVVNALEG